MTKPAGAYSVFEETSETAGVIEAELLTVLRDAQPQARNTGFVLGARETDGTLVGGLTASTSYGWLLIKTLWVDEPARGRGIGLTLMAQAEDKGRASGCHAAWLDTSNPAAKRFYAGLGYIVFAQLANVPGQHPERHRRWFMRKDLAPPDG